MASAYPKQLAHYQGYTLVQFDDNNLFLLSEEELKALGIEKDPKLKGFSPEKCITAITGLSLDNIKDRKYQVYGKKKKNILCLFRINNDKKWYYLSQSKLDTILGIKKKGGDKGFLQGAENSSYAQWMQKSKKKDKESHDGSYEKMKGSKKKNKGSDDDGDQEMKDYKSGEEDEDDAEVDEDDAEVDEDDAEVDEDDAEVDEGDAEEDDDNGEDAETVLESTEPSSPVTKHRFSSSKPKPTRPKTGKPRGRTESPPGVSGETPPPGVGGEILYGINCYHPSGKKKLRGLVRRGDLYSFEDLHDCRYELILPDKRGGMAPAVDTKFMSKLEKSDREAFEIVGCTAKWHGRPEKRVLVILKIKRGHSLGKRLQANRDGKGYGYSGPVVCSWPIFRDSVRQEGDQEVIQKLLNHSEFARDVPKKDLDLEARKVSEIKKIGSNMKSDMTELARKVDSLDLFVRSKL